MTDHALSPEEFAEREESRRRQAEVLREDWSRALCRAREHESALVARERECERRIRLARGEW